MSNTKNMTSDEKVIYNRGYQSGYRAGRVKKNRLTNELEYLIEAMPVYTDIWKNEDESYTCRYPIPDSRPEDHYYFNSATALGAVRKAWKHHFKDGLLYLAGVSSIDKQRIKP